MSLDYTLQPVDDLAIFTTSPGARRSSQFSAAWSDTLFELGREVEHLKGRDAVLEVACSVADLRKDGQLRSTAKLWHPGVRLSFTTPDGLMSFTCDTYETRPSGDSWKHNARAIAKTLEALRAVDRYGATKGEQYAGFKALPSGSGGIALGGMTRDEARIVLNHWASGAGSLDDMTLEQIHRRARARSHPDRHQGDQAGWDQVAEAARALGLES